jgi:phosphonate transport system substrate-binding protein
MSTQVLQQCARGALRWMLMLATLAAVLVAAGCARSEAGSVAGDTGPLRLAYLPGEEDPEGRLVAHQGLAEYLTAALGREVELVQASSYAPTIEAMRAGKIDIVRAGGPFTYLIAHEKAGAEAIVTVGTSAGPGLYRSAIVAFPGSGIDSMEELVARARQVDFAFVDPASASGHLIPRAQLERVGINPEEDFARTIFTMSHANSAMAIISGKVQAGAISEETYKRMLELGQMKASDMKVLWLSDPIPTGPVMVREGLPPELKQRLRDAYLALNKGDTEVYRTLSAVYRTEDLRFFPANDEQWDPLRKIATNISTMQMLPGS